MTWRFALLSLAALIAAPAAAQDAATPPPAPAAAAAEAAPAPRPAVVKVRLTTQLGDIVLELEKERAPVTTANFLRYVDAKRFDGIFFYRAMKLDWGGLIQAGVRDPTKFFPPIAHEPTTQTGLSHKEGVISMARLAPGTAVADFTIMVGDMSGLDANPQASGDNAGFAAFGRVVEGMDVVKAIWAAPTSPTEGEGVMKGQMLSPKIRVLTARRVP